MFDGLGTVMSGFADDLAGAAEGYAAGAIGGLAQKGIGQVTGTVTAFMGRKAGEVELLKGIDAATGGGLAARRARGEQQVKSIVESAAQRYALQGHESWEDFATYATQAQRDVARKIASKYPSVMKDLENALNGGKKPSAPSGGPVQVSAAVDPIGGYTGSAGGAGMPTEASNQYGLFNSKVTGLDTTKVAIAVVLFGGLFLYLKSRGG